jgi:hypothetical protein
MIRVASRSWVISLGCSLSENVETLIDFPHQKKAGIAGDLCTLKINADGAVKFRLYDSTLYVTKYAHPACPPSGRFVA